MERKTHRSLLSPSSVPVSPRLSPSRTVSASVTKSLRTIDSQTPSKSEARMPQRVGWDLGSGHITARRRSFSKMALKGRGGWTLGDFTDLRYNGIVTRCLSTNSQVVEPANRRRHPRGAAFRLETSKEGLSPYHGHQECQRETL